MNKNLATCTICALVGVHVIHACMPLSGDYHIHPEDYAPRPIRAGFVYVASGAAPSTIRGHVGGLVGRR